MLSAVELECVKGHNALFSNLSFTSERGQITQIIGQNGSGKTSLLRILTGLSLPESGDVLWEGKSIYRQRGTFHSELAYFGHTNAIKGELTALENIEAHQSLLDTAYDVSPAAALEKVGLGGYEEVYGFQLSAGQKRRVGLARLYLSKATLWILDEPVTAIDAAGVSEFEAVLTEHAQNGGIVIYTSHQSLNFPGIQPREVSVQ